MSPPPAGGFGGFQAAPSSAATEIIDASTPFIAAGDGDLELLKSSIEQLGISPNYADSNGFTFLHAAVGYCRVDVIEWLLGLNKEGETTIIDVNARDNEGDTPLHHCDDAISAKLLIKAGANPKLTNDEGKIPLEVKEEELEDGEEDDDDTDDNNNDDEDRLKLKELVAYLKSLDWGVSN